MAYLAIGTLPLTQMLTLRQEVLLHTLHAFQRCLRPVSHVSHHRADCMLHKALKLQAFSNLEEFFSLTPYATLLLSLPLVPYAALPGFLT